MTDSPGKKRKRVTRKRVDPKLVSKDNCPKGTHDGYRPHKEFPHICEDIGVRSLSIHDKGLFANRFLPKGTVIIDWDYDLPAFSCAELEEMERSGDLTEADKRYLWQIEDDVVLIDPGSDFDSDPANFINHSCDANSGIRCLHMLETLRDVEAGEELFFDYGTCEGDADATMTCLCQSKNCRGEVSGNDWKDPKFRARFGRRFLPFILRKIDALEKEQKTPSKSDTADTCDPCISGGCSSEGESKGDSEKSESSIVPEKSTNEGCCGSSNEACCGSESNGTVTGSDIKKHKASHH